MTRLVDLDAFAREDIQITLKGQQYTLPGDLDAEQFLRLMQLQQRLADVDPEAEDAEEVVRESMQSMYREMLDVFRINQPDLDSLPISFAQIGAAFAELTSLYEEGDAVPLQSTPTSPPSTPRSGNRSTRRKSAS